MTGDRIIHHVGGDYHEDNRDLTGNSGDVIENMGRDNIKYAPQLKQSLSEAASEIQQLLEQLEPTCSTDATIGKMQVAAEAIAHINSHPGLSQRILSALQAGGTAALEAILDHPAASFTIAALEDWQNSKQG